MQTWEFTLTLSDTDLTEDQVETLYSIVDDGTSGACNGIWSIHFDRDAESLEAAIRSAIADVQKAGCTVKKVEIETEALALVKPN